MGILNQINLFAVILIVTLLFIFSPSALAGNEDVETGDEDTVQAGAATVPLQGPSGVIREIKRAYQKVESVLGAPLQRYLEWKQNLRDRTGFSYSLLGLWLGQRASDSLTENKNGLGQIYRLNMGWKLVGRGTGHVGGIEARLEYRSAFGGAISPSRLGNEIGVAAVNPGFVYIDRYDLDLAVLNWTQMLIDGKLGLAAGRLAFDAYLDGSPVQSATAGFLNRAFVLNPALGTTGIGALGAVIKGDLPGGFWLGAQIHDANAVSGKFNHDAFDQNEWLKAAELGWTPSPERYPFDQVRFTYWAKDARTETDQPSGKGWVVSASYKIGERFLPFLRFGHSDGGGGVLAENALSGGFEFSTFPNQTWALGLGWSEPSRKTFGEDLRNETVLETSYRIQLFQSLSVMPNTQVIINPARNPDQDTIWVLGLRATITL